jgi:hypothetical protein
VSAAEVSLISARYIYDVLATHGSTKGPTRNLMDSSLVRLVSASNLEADNRHDVHILGRRRDAHQTDARRVTATYTVDGADRLLKKDYNDGSIVVGPGLVCR